MTTSKKDVCGEIHNTTTKSARIFEDISSKIKMEENVGQKGQENVVNMTPGSVAGKNSKTAGSPRNGSPTSGAAIGGSGLSTVRGIEDIWKEPSTATVTSTQASERRRNGIISFLFCGWLDY